MQNISSLNQNNIPLTWFCILPIEIRHLIQKYLNLFKYQNNVLPELLIKTKFVKIY